MNDITLNLEEIEKNENMFFDAIIWKGTDEDLKSCIISFLTQTDGKEKIEKFIERISDEIDTLQEMQDEYDKEDFESDYCTLAHKLELTKKVVKKQDDERELDEEDYNGVLFATNGYGNIMIEHDLMKFRRNCSSDMYDSFLELIEDIATKNESRNVEKSRNIINNSKTDGLVERKGYQSRVLYRHAGGYVIIVGIYLKKADTDKRYDNFLIKTRSSSDQYVNNINSGKIDIDKATRESMDFYEKIIDTKMKGEMKK